ncbi:MAG: hypothetical protein LWW93_16580 [Hyphomicrobiales bacterium]|nr:hypothetical protein [Hyphomicrobiales bacterium]
MLYQLAIAAYATTCGFVAAGILSSFYTLVTNRPVSFAVELGTLWRGLVDLVMCAFAGPFIIMRNAIRGRIIEQRPVGWLVASTAIAAGWSLCSGIVVVQFALAMRSGLF